MSSTACCHEFAAILKYLCQISWGKSINFDKLRLMSQKMLLSGIGVSFKFSYTQCLKYGLFTWLAISLENHMSLLIRTRDPKISYGFGVTITYAHSVGFVYFVIRIVLSRSFLISFRNFFSYVLPCFLQNLFHHFIIE